MEKRPFIIPKFTSLSPFQSERYDKSLVDKTIEDETRRKQWIVHGAKALNKQVTPEFQRRTKDWDLFSESPKQSSLHLERQIETAIQKDIFDQAEIPLTASSEIVYRIVLKSTGEEIVDFMKTPNHKNLYTVIGGIRYETLEHAKEMHEKVLANPIYSHRWDKARRDLNAIESFEKKLDKGQPIRKGDIPSPFTIMKFKPMWG
jgi:hypothetical protein